MIMTASCESSKIELVGAEIDISTGGMLVDEPPPQLTKNGTSTRKDALNIRYTTSSQENLCPSSLRNDRILNDYIELLYRRIRL